MTRPSASHARPSRLRTVALLAAIFGIAVSGVGMALPAHAATTPTVTVVPASIGTDRVASAKLTCTTTKPCAGTVTLKLSTGGTKKVGYTIAAKGTTGVSFTLTAAQYAAFVKKGSATLTLSGAATKPSAATFTSKATVRPAVPKLAVKATSYAVAATRAIPLSLSCAAATGCSAKVSLTLAGKSVASTTVATKAPGAVTAKVSLPTASYNALTTTGTTYKVVVAESKPDAVSRTTTVTLKRPIPATPKPTPTPTPTPTAPVREEATAFAERNWTPTSYDTCPASLHESFSVIGPDGKIYPTWHPAQTTDPATGALCTFGHEHGADPATSDIFAWVADFYSPTDLAAGEKAGLPFGYVSENLDDHIAHGHAGMSMRHEDNGGHKVFIADDVRMLDADREWLSLADGTPLTCDYLIKQHQGSWSPDATSNNAHETLFAVKCNDGTEVITSMMSRFGDANEMFSTCAADVPIATVGSKLPAGDGGKRIIPTLECVSDNATDWSLYEVWEAESAITTPSGDELLFFDPWFGIRNPSRMYAPLASTATSNGIAHPLNLVWDPNVLASDYLWAKVDEADPYAVRDPRSPFNGAQRDFYLAQLRVSTPNAQGVVYADPYGGGAVDAPTHGYAEQVLRAGSVLGETALTRQKFDSNADYGKNNGVHAPN